MKPFLILTVAFTFLFNGLSAFAADESPISIVSSAEIEQVVINAKGEKEVKRVPAAKVMPGSTVVFSNTCTNNGSEAIENIIINNPVPEHMVYIEGSATGPGTTVSFSVDNGQNYDAPENLIIVEQDGSTRPAANSDYTHIRWQLAGFLGSQESRVVEFKARVK